MSPRQAWLASLLLIMIGLALSAYLLARVFAVIASPGPASFDLCSWLFSSSCDAALAGKRSWILGVPVAGWGLVFFTSLAGLLLLGRLMRGGFEPEALLAAWLLTLAGVGVGIALSVAELMSRVPLCPLCLSVHAINLLLALALWRSSARPVREQARLLRGVWEWLRSKAETPEPLRWKLVGFASVGLLAAVAYQWVYVESALRLPRTAPPDRARVIAEYQASPRLTVPVAEEDPHLGPLTAPVQLVVFASFRCPSCERFASTLSRLHQRFGDRLLVAYKYYPLSNQCNARLTVDQQPGACEVAWAAEAAHRQGRFWPFHDALFAAGTEGSERTIAETVQRLNLDPARFAADRRSDFAKNRVAEDVELGNRLKIPGTPTVFLDGHLVRLARDEILEILIRHELDQ